MNISQSLSQLVQIPSINPDAGEHPSYADQFGEGRMATFLAERFRALGATVELEQVLPGRPNVMAWWPGKSGRWAAIDVHTDTVGVSQMTDPPYDGRIENGRVWGRGAVDTKATLGILLALLEEAQRSGRELAHNLLIVGTVSEEIGGYGAAAFADWVRRKEIPLAQLLVAEPTLCAPIYAHKGVMKMVYRVQGKAAHSSTPHMGQNAIVAAASIIKALQGEQERLQTIPAETELGTAVLSVTLIDGGNGHNIIPETCDITLNRRLIPGEEPEAIMDAVDALVQAACPLPVQRTYGNGLPAFYQSPDSPWLAQMAEWSGERPQVAPYGTNALAYHGLAEETVIFGPGSIDQAHGAVEWVEISELEKAAGVLQRWLFV